MRPICSAVGSATYELSKYLTRIIKPASINRHGTDLTDTFQFVRQTTGMDLSGKFMVSFDVKPLFTNVPLKEIIDVTIRRMYHSDFITPPVIPENNLRDLLELCVSDNLILFNGKVFKQTDGVAMGNSLGPVLANIFMIHLEEELMFSGTNNCQPLFYRRYVDDTFCVFENQSQAERFLKFINDLHPSVNFDMETECDGTLGFLDTVVRRNNQNTADLSTKVKQTDRGLFYHFSSLVPDSYKLNLVYNLINRICNIASNMLIFHLDFEHLKRRLKMNGFPQDLVNRTADKVLTRQRSEEQPRDETVEKRKVNNARLTGQTSYGVKSDLDKLVRKFYPSVDLRMIFTRGFKIKNLFGYEDKFPLKCKSLVVYYSECSQCGHSKAYLGKIKNSLYERFYASGTGHLAPNCANSALLNHLCESENPKCSFNFKDVKILETARNDLQLRYMESILLKYEKQTLNTQERSIRLNLI